MGLQAAAGGLRAGAGCPCSTDNRSVSRGGRIAQFQQELGLSADQSARIDAIFQAAISQLRPKKEELDKQEDQLSQLIVAGADEALVTRQVDKVEAIRSQMNKMRTLMLLKERQVLSPEQRVKLNKLHEQWERDHKRPIADAETSSKWRELAMTRNGSTLDAHRGARAVGPRLAGARAGVGSAHSRTDQTGGGSEQPAAGAGDGASRRDGDNAPGGRRSRLDDAVKFALDRNLDIAVQRLNPEINDIAYASIKSIYHPSADVAALDRVDDQPVDQHDLGRLAAGQPIVAGVDHLQRRHRPEHSLGRRQLHGGAEQPQEHDDQPEHAVQPDLSAELVGHLRPAAAPQLHDRLDAALAAGHQDQPRHLRHPAARHDHQHAVERAQRLLGLRLRGAVGRRRAAVGRPRDAAREGQPDARRGRHDGADRRRAGAVAGRDAAADCWSRRWARCGPRSSRSSG